MLSLSLATGVPMAVVLLIAFGVLAYAARGRRGRRPSLRRRSPLGLLARVRTRAARVVVGRAHVGHRRPDEPEPALI